MSEQPTPEQVQDNIKRLEHENFPDRDYRLDHAAEDGTPCRWCVKWVRQFTENLADPIFSPDAQGYLPGQPRV